MCSLWLFQRVLRRIQVQASFWMHHNCCWRSSGHQRLRIFCDEFGGAATFHQTGGFISVLCYYIIVETNPSLRNLVFGFLILLRRLFFRWIRNWSFGLSLCHWYLSLYSLWRVGSCVDNWSFICGSCLLGYKSLIRRCIFRGSACWRNINCWSVICYWLPTFCHIWISSSRFAFLLILFFSYLVLSRYKLLLLL